MTGFDTPDYADRYPQARAELAGWLREGRLISREQIIEGGVRAFPDALSMLFAGENFGKLIVAVAPTATSGVPGREKFFEHRATGVSADG